MAIVAHLTMLEEKHGKLETMLAQESRRPMPDFTTIQMLKKQKLLLKEEIARLRTLAGGHFDAA